MTQLAIDFGKTAQDYTTHRAGFPPALLARLHPFGIGLPRQRVLDIGTGTGTLARQFAQQGSIVTGLDIAEPLLEQAKKLDQEAGVKVEYLSGKAENLPLAAESLDVVTAGQCWHWFNAEAASTEVHRVLKPGGAILICHFNWLPLPGNVVETTEQLILKHNPAWDLAGGTGFHPEWLSHLAQAGFIGLETFSFDVDVPYTHEGWRGRIRASAGVSASLPPESVKTFDDEHKGILAKQFPKEPLIAPHRVWAVIGRKPCNA